MHKVLVIGAGSIGERHIRCFRHSKRAAVSVCEIDDRVRGKIESDYAICNSDSSLSTALSSKPDAVVVATPAHLHVPMALDAARAGCHVLIEEPLATSLEGIDALNEFVADRQIVRVAYVFRHHPAIATVKASIDQGSWGKPLQLTVQSGQHFPTYRPAYREIYYASHETGGGAIQDGLTHFLDVGQWWLGPIGSLVGDASHLRLDGVDVEDTVSVLARHGSVMANYHFNQHQFPNEATLTLTCEQATVRVELTKNKLLVMKEPASEWDQCSSADVERDDVFVNQANAFLDEIEGKQTCSCTPEEALQTLRCQLALLEDFKNNDRTKWHRIHE